MVPVFRESLGKGGMGLWRRSEQGKGRCEKEDHGRAGHGAAEMGQVHTVKRGLRLGTFW